MDSGPTFTAVGICLCRHQAPTRWQRGGEFLASRAGDDGLRPPWAQTGDKPLDGCRRPQLAPRLHPLRPQQRAYAPPPGRRAVEGAPASLKAQTLCFIVVREVRTARL